MDTQILASSKMAKYTDESSIGFNITDMANTKVKQMNSQLGWMLATQPEMSMIDIAQTLNQKHL